MKKKTFSAGMNVGSSSILVTFVLLCLVTFAALSFVSANADNKLAKQTAERVSAFYAADCTAEINLANIDGQLNMLVNNVSTEKEFYEGIEDLFSDNNLYTVIYNNDDVYINYEIPVNDIQSLSVSLKAVYPKNEGDSSFIISEWETYTTYVPEETTLEEEKGNLLF